MFNTAQCEGLSEDIAVAAPPPPPGTIEPRVEALIRATGIDVHIGGDRAFYRHVASALARLAPGGRLVTITGAGFS